MSSLPTLRQASSRLLHLAHQGAFSKACFNNTPTNLIHSEPLIPSLKPIRTLAFFSAPTTNRSKAQFQRQISYQFRSFTRTSRWQAAPSVAPHTAEPAPITLDQYHKLSDVYIDALVAQLEELQEEREDVDVEYSAGVLTLTFPPHGTYVLNKQPPNKQIWLSSPVSGPKRYDWVVPPEDGKGEWVYLRDGSTLSGLLEGEVGVKPHVDVLDDEEGS